MKASRPSLPTIDLILAMIAVAMLLLPLPILVRSSSGDLMAKAMLFGAIVLPPAAVLVWAQLRYGPSSPAPGPYRR